MVLLYLLCFLFLNGAISQSQSWVTALDQPNFNIPTNPLWQTFLSDNSTANVVGTCGSLGSIFGLNTTGNSITGLSRDHRVTWGPYSHPASRIRGIRVIATVVGLDSWDSDRSPERLFISYNGMSGNLGAYMMDVTNSTINYCANGGRADSYLDINASATSLDLQSFTLTLHTTLDQSAEDESWGIRTFRVEVLIDCNSCTDNNNQQCNGSPLAICTTTSDCQRVCTCPEDHLGTTNLTGPAVFPGCTVKTCTTNSDCASGLCDVNLGTCYKECLDPPSNASCTIHHFRSSEDLIIPKSPEFQVIFSPILKSFVFTVITDYTRTNTSYVLGLDDFIDNRAIRDVGLCENRNSNLFTYDNRRWWCSPSDAYGIGSPDYLAWGPSMSWNQTATSCNTVVFTRAFTLKDLHKTCSKPGSVIASSDASKLVYDGTFHVTLAQEDFEWTPTSLIPLAKWNFPFKFSFVRDFRIVSCFVAERISTKVKQGVSVFNKNRLHIFVDTRIETLYGPDAYVVLVSGMNSTNNLVVFPDSVFKPLERGLTNRPDGTRTHQPGASGTGPGCVFPTCQQVWNFLSNPIPNTANFAGIYSVTFRVRGSTQSPYEDIDSFTISITLDTTFVPETTTAIDNIEFESRLTIYSDDKFNSTAPPTGFRQTQTAYAVQNITLSPDDRDLWVLQLVNATICVVPVGSFGCQNAIEKYLIYSNGITTGTNVSSFNTVFYPPGTVPRHEYLSAAGLSFSVRPLTNNYPLRRSHCIEFVSLASLSAGTGNVKRSVQQNAKVLQTIMFNIQDDRVITDYETNDELTNEVSQDKLSSSIGSNTMIAMIGLAFAGTVMLVMFISFVVFRYKTMVAEKDIQAVRLNADSESESETQSETVTYL